MLSTGEAIQKLRDTEEMLMKKQEFFEKKIEEELAIAKKNGTKNKRGMYSLCDMILQLFIKLKFLLLVAIQALKKKKRLEKQLQQIDGTLTTIELQREALECANTNTAVLQTMNEAAKALKAAHQHMYSFKIVQ